MQIYLDHSATTQLQPQVKEYIIELLDNYYNPSSLYQGGIATREIIEQARINVAKFINCNYNNIIFTSSGSASNSLAIKGIIKGNIKSIEFLPFYSPTAHKSMIKACESCPFSVPLSVNKYGQIDLEKLETSLKEVNILKPLVCIEAGNSEIGTINDIVSISNIVHKYNGKLIVDATGYISSCKVDMKMWEKVDVLTFSAHKLGALKGCGILYKKPDIKLEPLVYGSQENGLFGGTEGVINIASLGKAVENYDYSSISSKNRDYIYEYIKQNIPDSYLVGTPIGKNRLPHNLYICFKGVQGESLMTILDMNGIQVSTGSACNGNDIKPSSALTAIGMNKNDIHSCIRLSFSGNESKQELNYACEKLRICVKQLRDFS